MNGHAGETDAHSSFNVLSEHVPGLRINILLEERIYFKLRARFGTVGGQLNAFVQRSN
jgi:hypothetical protein